MFDALAALEVARHTHLIDITREKHTARPPAQKGEQNQAIGRSRGGRNTKIHAIGDAKGRLLTIMLTGGKAHDSHSGAELILQQPTGKTLLGDKAYDSAELRASLKERGTQAIIPNRCNRKRKFKFSKKRYANGIALRMPSAGSKTSAA